MTRRSSARLTPRTAVGKCGWIRAHCSSLSQNRFLLINPSPNTNQYRIVEPEGLMSSDPSPSPSSGWTEDFHLQAVVHTRHTANGSRYCAPDDRLREAIHKSCRNQ